MGCSTIEKKEKEIVFVIYVPGFIGTTQREKIVKNFQYKSFHPGNLLRQYVKDKKDGYEEIENLMKEGEVISSSIVMKVLKEYIINSLNTKILVDGFPRKQEHIDIWEKEMKDKVVVKGVLYIEISNEEMIKRLLGREQGIFDDFEEIVKKRIETFEKETKPIVEYFEKQGKLIKIDGMKTEDEISKEIEEKFKEKGLD